MWISRLCNILLGIGAGTSTAAGYFAIISTIGVVNRFAWHTHTVDRLRLYEWMLILGGTIGNLLIIFLPGAFALVVLWSIFSLAAGMFVGCFLVSLGEAVKGIPIFLHRTNIVTGLWTIIMVFAVGKGLGSIFYFLTGRFGE